MDSQVHNRKDASSISLLLSKESLEKMILFLCCQMVHVTASHQHFHLVILIPPIDMEPCCRKCCLGSFGKAPEMFNHDDDSHQIWRIASSSIFPQNGQLLSVTSICRLCKFTLVGNLSLSSLQANTTTLIGTFNFHSSSKALSCIPSTSAPLIRLYADRAVYCLL